MARPLHLEFTGTLSLVTLRGDRREHIYESDRDRKLFLATFCRVCDRFDWGCHAYCLMSVTLYLLLTS